MREEPRDRVAFYVPGVPVAKQRPRGTIKKRKGARGIKPEDYYIQWYSQEKKGRLYEQAARWPITVAMRNRPIFTGPVSVRFVFFFPVPPSWPKAKQRLALAGMLPHSVKPDIDNVEKIILDACNGLAWTDDARVCSLAKDKMYAPEGREPGVYVSIEAWRKPAADLDQFFPKEEALF